VPQEAQSPLIIWGGGQ